MLPIEIQCIQLGFRYVHDIRVFAKSIRKGTKHNNNNIAWNQPLTHNCRIIIECANPRSCEGSILARVSHLGIMNRASQATKVGIFSSSFSRENSQPNSIIIQHSFRHTNINHSTTFNLKCNNWKHNLKVRFESLAMTKKFSLLYNIYPRSHYSFLRDWNDNNINFTFQSTQNHQGQL